MHRMRICLITILALAAVVAVGYTFQQAEEPATNSVLMNPAALNETAPDTYQARFDTSRGTIVIQVRRAWAPHGADRFYNLVKNGYYDGCRFFRVIYSFAAQVGIHGDPKTNAIWAQAPIPDDPVKQSNRKGYVSFAKAGPNSRTTQIFINLSDENVILDGMGFAPFGTVIKGTTVITELYYEYGDGPPQGRGPDQGLLQIQGNAYLEKEFPRLDYIKSASIVPQK